MKRFLFSSTLVLLLIPGTLFAQRDSLRTVFLDAESWFLFEEYADALPLYEDLLKLDPGNDNLKYKIGICLLNNPYQKDRAIGYLLDASSNINPEYKENSYKETTAPPDVLYYLGDAYLVNELLDRAIEAYNRFLEIMDREVYDEELVLAQIQACENARRLKTMPLDLDLVLLDSMINTRYSDIHPVISGDGSKMAFVTELPFYDGAFFCEKTGEGWSYPQAITQTLGFDADVYPASLSYDGTEMILYYDDEYIGNLYYSIYEDGRWLPATKLEEPISTKFWESHGCFSKDGKTLYFTSNRKGTNGGLDIYKSERQPDGTWGEPENLGPTINSRYNEETPFISGDGQTLYFSSYGHYNMGGYDIFLSRKNADGTWGEPVNLGYPINTTDDDLFFQPLPSGFGAYYSLFSPSGIGRHDIYQMTIYSADNPRMYLVTGNLRTEDGKMDGSGLSIFVIDSQTGDTVMIASPERGSGAFSLNLKQGIYELHFTGEGYEELIRPLQITRHSDKQGITLQDDIELALVQKEPIIFEGDESDIQLRDTLYEAMAGETIEIPLRLKKGSTLITRVYQDSVLVSTDTIEIDRRRTTLEIEPLPGTSRIELEMIDEDGNIHRNELTVTGKEPEKQVQEEILIEEIGQTGEEEQAEEGLIESPDQLPKPPAEVDLEKVEIMKNLLQRQSEGALKETLENLDPAAEGINSQSALFRYLYDQSDEKGFTEEEVDELLTKAVSGGDVENLLQQLKEYAEGPLREYLEQLDMEAEGIETPEDLLLHLKEVASSQGFTMDEVREALLRSLENEPLEKSNLFELLYQNADSYGYSLEEVDQLLAEALAHNDALLLYQYLLENSEGALKVYLETLDLENEGIKTAADLLRHLKDAAAANGFSPEDLRKAMMSGLENPLEVDQVYLDLLESAEDPVKEILENLDLRREGIYTVEQLIEALYDALVEMGYSRRDIQKILNSLFESYSDFIKDLGKRGDRDGAKRGDRKSGERGDRKGWPIALIVGAGAAFLLLIFWWRRRKNE